MFLQFSPIVSQPRKSTLKRRRDNRISQRRINVKMTQKHPDLIEIDLGRQNVFLHLANLNQAFYDVTEHLKVNDAYGQLLPLPRQSSIRRSLPMKFIHVSSDTIILKMLVPVLPRSYIPCSLSYLIINLFHIYLYFFNKHNFIKYILCKSIVHDSLI